MRTILFSVVLGFVCSLLLAGTSLFTGPYRDANRKAEEVRNFLSALDVEVDEDADAKTLLTIFDENIRTNVRGGVTLYEYVPASSGAQTPLAIAVPFSGPGLWGPIKAVMALEPDMKTIKGVRFYDQEETPGLGGEIGADWFQKQFIGKELVSASGLPGFNIVKPGTALDKNSVDGITGATMTSERVRDMVDSLAKKLLEDR